MNSELSKGDFLFLPKASSQAAEVHDPARHSSPARSRQEPGRALFTRHLVLAAAIVFALVVPNAWADELTLKDGHKVSGTIVGFENGMFRLETEYGFELIRKDKVVSIKITAGAGKEVSPRDEANKNSDISPLGRDAAGLNHPAGATASATSSRTTPPVSRLVNEPLPAHIEQHEDGTNYINDTFRFSMFKPPGWKIYDELPRGKVSAIVALASEDEQTLLFVDRQVWSGEPDLKTDSVEKNLRQIYEDYKKLSETDMQVDARPAIRSSFTGIMDGVEWHGVAVHVAQGSVVFGIIEMTSAEGYQFQEAVFNKIVKSFHFLNATSDASPSSAQNAITNRIQK